MQAWAKDLRGVVHDDLIGTPARETKIGKWSGWPVKTIMPLIARHKGAGHVAALGDGVTDLTAIPEMRHQRLAAMAQLDHEEAEREMGFIARPVPAAATRVLLQRKLGKKLAAGSLLERHR